MERRSVFQFASEPMSHSWPDDFTSNPDNGTPSGDGLRYGDITPTVMASVVDMERQRLDLRCCGAF